MKRLLTFIFILVFPVVVFAATFENDLDRHADDAAADTYLTTKGWTPIQGMYYWDTTLDKQRCLDTGLVWIDCDTNTTHVQSTANPHTTGVPNLGAGTKAQLDAVISDGDVVPQWQTDLFVDQTSGSDVTPGPWGYATIGGALAVSASGDTIFVNPATYAENISIPVGVRVLGEWAVLDGTAILEGDDSYISLYMQPVATGTTGLTLAGVNTTAAADIRYQLCAGTADCISVTDSASTLFYSGTLQTVVDGEGLSSGSAGSVYYDLPLIHVSGTGTGVYVSPTADATGSIGQCDDDGAGTCLYLEALGGAQLDMWRIDAATAYDVEAAAELRLSANEIIGAEINAGTAVVVTFDEIDANSMSRTAPTLTAGAEAANVIAVTFASPVVSVEQYIVEAFPATTMEPATAAFICAETGVGAEISTTARGRLIFTTDAAGDATISTTDVAGASNETVWLTVRPLFVSADVAQQCAPVTISIAFDGV